MMKHVFNLVSLVFVNIAFMVAPQVATAAPQTYNLNAPGSAVSFVFVMAGNSVRGRMPVSDSQIQIDPENFANTRFNVLLDPRRASTGLGPVTEAMKGRSVLDARRHSQVSFRTLRATLDGNTGKLVGELTMRGVTRPLTLNAVFFRPEDAPAGDNSNLSVSLTGNLNRHDFGASGFRALVDGNVSIDITAQVTAAN